MYNYRMGYVWNWVGLNVKYGCYLHGMLTLWGEILLTFGVNFRVSIRLFYGGDE